SLFVSMFYFNNTLSSYIYTLSLHDGLPISINLNYIVVMSYVKEGSLRKCLHNIINFNWHNKLKLLRKLILGLKVIHESGLTLSRSEEHTSELQSLRHLVCRLLLEKKKKNKY